MDLRQLRYFVAVAEQKNFSRAAVELRIAQTALSRQIAQLEAELGKKLFVRHARGVVATEEAHFLVDRARHMLHYVEQTKNEVIALRGVPTGKVVLGLNPSTAIRLGPSILSTCMTELPKVQLCIIEAHNPTLTDQLVNGQMDLALINEPLDLSRLVLKPIMQEKICLIGLPQPLLAEKKPIEPGALGEIPMILGSFATSGVRNALERVIAQTGGKVRIIAEVNSILAVSEMVKKGLGYTANLSSTLHQDLVAGNLAARPIRGLQLTRVLAHSREYSPSRAAWELASLVTRLIHCEIRAHTWPNALVAQ